MKRILLSWIGIQDLKASDGAEQSGTGPLARAIMDRGFDKAVLLTDFTRTKYGPYIAWLKKQITHLPEKRRTNVTVKKVTLSSPTDFGDIYKSALGAIQSVPRAEKEDLHFTFHLSPGTPAMAAVWLILAKTRCPAELIQSSPEKGVETVPPFDFSTDFVADLLHKPDEDLVRISEGLPPEAPEFKHIIHRCDEMKALIAGARRVAVRNVPVLLLGESGTGKELLARAIHEASPRKGKLGAVNCGAIPSDLLESELFGHRKGSFSGAYRDRIGSFVVADGGTLFLDEIADLRHEHQVKLLRALQEGEITPVGAEKPQKVDVRVIAATNKDLASEVSKGAFREDLFHRVAVAVLKLPPLRERKGDLTLLIQFIMKEINEEAEEHQPGYRRKNLSDAAKSLLLRQPWPGNFRELKNTLLRAAIWSDERTITEKEIQQALLPVSSDSSICILGRPFGENFSLDEICSEVEKHYLLRALEETHGNKTQAAQLVGLASQQTFTNRLKRLGLT